MALSNRDRIGRMFEVLAPALDGYLSSTVDGHYEGLCWFDLFDEMDRQRGRASREVDASDVQVQLRFISEGITNQLRRGWRPVRDQIGHTGESYASELREARNDWAHLKRFSDDDAYRALDTCERLLKLIGAGAEADRIARLRLDLRRVTADKDDRRTLSSAVVPTESHGLRPWREVLQPQPTSPPATSRRRSSPRICTKWPRAIRTPAGSTPTRSSSSTAPISPKASATSSAGPSAGSAATTMPPR